VFFHSLAHRLCGLQIKKNVNYIHNTCSNIIPGHGLEKTVDLDENGYHDTNTQFISFS